MEENKVNLANGEYLDQEYLRHTNLCNCDNCKKINLNKITIDSYQVLPKDINLNKITSEICISKNPKVALFLKENKHLINTNILDYSDEDWTFDFLLNENIIFEKGNIILFGFAQSNNKKKLNYVYNIILDNNVNIRDRLFTLSGLVNSSKMNSDTFNYIIENYDFFKNDKDFREYFGQISFHSKFIEYLFNEYVKNIKKNK